MVLPSCKNTANTSGHKNTISNETVEQASTAVKKIEVDKRFEVIVEDLQFNLKKVQVEGNYLKAEVTYSGGCIDNHEFELVTSGSIKEDGIMDIWLLHKTKGDECKKMFVEERYFDISKILRLRSNKLKGFRVNEDKTFSTIAK